MFTEILFEFSNHNTQFEFLHYFSIYRALCYMVRLYTLGSFVFIQSNFKILTSCWMKLSIQFTDKVIMYLLCGKNLLSFTFLISKNMWINWTRQKIISSMCCAALWWYLDGENQTEVIFVRKEEKKWPCQKFEAIWVVCKWDFLGFFWSLHFP